MKQNLVIFFMRLQFLFVFVFVMNKTVFIVNADNFNEAPEKHWNFEELSNVPAYRISPYADSKCEGLQDFLIEGKKVDGKVKEFFAYFSYPNCPMPDGGYPGVLLIHGGGGTAYPYFIKRWLNKGYAVMALDWYNRRPLSALKTSPGKSVERAELEGGTRSIHTANVTNSIHIINVANMIIAHSLLRSFEKIDPNKTIFVGLSWGSWYGAMLAAVDSRFKGGIQIYCGDLKRENNSFINGRFLHASKVPLYWIAGTNDANASPSSIQDAFDTATHSENKSIVIKLTHSHIGFLFPACFRMADYFLKDGEGLPKLGKTTIEGNRVSSEILGQGKGIKKAILCYTKDKDKNVPHERVWKSIPVEFDDEKIQAELPEGCFQCFFSAYDEESNFNDLCGSSDLLELK